MGIDTRAAVFVGLPRKEVQSEQLQDWIDDGTLKVCPPYYDGNHESYAIVGFELAGCGCYEPREFAWNQEECERLRAEFKELTGKDAKVWLSPYIF